MCRDVRRTLCVPCGHLCICAGACLQLTQRSGKCPLCRLDIQDLLQLY